MRKRQQLSEEGMCVSARIKVQSGERFGPPDMVSRGFVGSQVQNGLVDEPGIVVMKALEQTAKQRSTNWGELLAAFGAA